MKIINQILQFVVVSVVSLLAVTFADAQIVVKPTPEVKTAPKITSSPQLERQWDLLWKKRIFDALQTETRIDPKTKKKTLDPRNVISIKLNSLTELLEQTEAKIIQNEIDRAADFTFNSSQKLQAYNDYFVYRDYLLMSLVQYLAVNKNSDALTYLIAGNCPSIIGGNSVESFLAAYSLDNLSVLFDAYKNSFGKNAGNILKILKTIFGDECDDCRKAVGRKQDELFVEVSRKWFENNKDKLVLNPYYSPSASFGTTGYGLFRPKQMG